MDIPGQAPEATGMTEAQAAETILARLTREEGQSAGEETLGDEDPQAEDEDEAPAEDESEEQSDDDETEGEAEQQPDLHAIKIDGQEQKVTLDELKAGYQREADYRRKTMAVADERKALEPEKAALATERARTTELLKALETALEAPTISQADLDYLRANNPAEYAAAVADQIQRDKQKDAAKAERQRLEGIAQQEEVTARKAALKDEGDKLIAARPDWKDPAKAKAVNAAIKGYAEAMGVTPQELDSVSDHRILIALHEAALYRQLVAKTPQTKAKVEQVKTAKPGNVSQPASKVSETTRAKQRLAKTGRVDDAAAVFLSRL